jgi:hypothetical protein
MVKETSYILEPVTTYQNGASPYWPYSIDKWFVVNSQHSGKHDPRVPVLKASKLDEHPF